MGTPASERLFLERFEAALEHIEHAIEASGADIETDRSGNVLTLEFPDESDCPHPGSKIIINSQAALEEIWVAAKSGGFHYRFDGTHWRDTRSGDELFTTLGMLIASQGGLNIDF